MVNLWSRKLSGPTMCVQTCADLSVHIEQSLTAIKWIIRLAVDIIAVGSLLAKNVPRPYLVLRLLLLNCWSCWNCFRIPLVRKQERKLVKFDGNHELANNLSNCKLQLILLIAIIKHMALNPSSWLRSVESGWAFWISGNCWMWKWNYCGEEEGHCDCTRSRWQ